MARKKQRREFIEQRSENAKQLLKKRKSKRQR
jgi:hypothetical protein